MDIVEFLILEYILRYCCFDKEDCSVDRFFKKIESFSWGL